MSIETLKDYFPRPLNSCLNIFRLHIYINNSLSVFACYMWWNGVCKQLFLRSWRGVLSVLPSSDRHRPAQSGANLHRPAQTCTYRHGVLRVALETGTDRHRPAPTSIDRQRPAQFCTDRHGVLKVSLKKLNIFKTAFSQKILKLSKKSRFSLFQKVIIITFLVKLDIKFGKRIKN